VAAKDCEYIPVIDCADQVRAKTIDEIYIGIYVRAVSNTTTRTISRCQRQLANNYTHGIHINVKMTITIPQNLINELREYNRRLDQNTAKWLWPRNIIEKIHDVSERIRPDLTKELYDLMAWPDADSASKTGFYEGGKFVLPGHRTEEGWFERHGYEKHMTTYTYSPGLDKRVIMAAFYIPHNLKSNTEVPTMWFFHGGGFVST
jgi:hypothetical protein